MECINITIYDIPDDDVEMEKMMEKIEGALDDLRIRYWIEIVEPESGRTNLTAGEHDQGGAL